MRTALEKLYAATVDRQERETLDALLTRAGLRSEDGNIAEPRLDVTAIIVTNGEVEVFLFEHEDDARAFAKTCGVDASVVAEPIFNRRDAKQLREARD